MLTEEQRKANGRGYNKKHREANRDKIRGYNKKYREANRDKKRGYDKKHKTTYRLQYLLIFTPTGEQPSCAECGETDIEYLQGHHFNHNGKEERERYGGQRLMMFNYIKNPEEARKQVILLCYKCHRKTHSTTLKMRKRMAEVNNNTLDCYIGGFRS